MFGSMPYFGTQFLEHNFWRVLWLYANLVFFFIFSLQGYGYFPLIRMFQILIFWWQVGVGNCKPFTVVIFLFNIIFCLFKVFCLIDHWSLIIDHWLLIIDHWSLIIAKLLIVSYVNFWAFHTQPSCVHHFTQVSCDCCVLSSSFPSFSHTQEFFVWMQGFFRPRLLSP